MLWAQAAHAQVTAGSGHFGPAGVPGPANMMIERFPWVTPGAWLPEGGSPGRLHR